jgi:hypothetical protein
MRGLVLVAALLVALLAPFIHKPFHMDDPTFLRLAEGVARDPWRPQAIEINWIGTTEPAFAVLSNPPGLGYWLAPVRSGPEWLVHLWMSVWLVPLVWGARRLGQALAGDGLALVLLLVSSPIVVLAAQSAMPDLPLLACTVAGLGGFLTARRHAWIWALVAGSSVLFRYSGLCVVLLVLAVGIQRGRFKASLAALAAPVALVVHDLLAYDAVHLLAAAGFQRSGFPAWPAFRRTAAAIAMLGGAGILPVLAFRGRAVWAWACGGALLGLVAALASGHDVVQGTATVAHMIAGAVTLTAVRFKTADDRWVAAWALGGLAFFLGPLFAATRYWMPFLPALALAGLRLGPTRARLALAVALQAIVALGLSVDDFRLARAYRDAASELARMGPGTFAGHWGFQHYLEQAGWKPLEAGSWPDSERLAVAWQAWPQPPAPGACRTIERTIELDDHFPGPRVLSASAAANLHSYLIAPVPPREETVRSYAPWSFSDEPYDRVSVLRCSRR